MNTESILRMAEEVGITEETANGYPSNKAVISFAQAIEAQVREECAAICEAHGNERWILRPTRITDDPWKVGVFDCVELLRGDYKL